MPVKYFNGRPTIGLLCNNIDGEYQQIMLSGFVSAAKTRNINTIYFTGGILDAVESPRNRIHEIISTNNIDGLVVVSSVVCGYVTPEETIKFFGKFDKFPCVSVGMQVPNIPSIIIDNESGMKSIVDHLIEKHGFRNFFYIGGPVINPEANHRLTAFLKSLEEHDLHIKPEMITDGNFYPSTIAYDLTKELLNKKIYPDAIVSANDIMAMGAINAIIESKMLIPDDIAITGYDDLKYLRFLSVPLTTVRQPFADMMANALNMILDMIDGNEVPQITLMNTEPVIRRSCGCLFPEINAALKKEFSFIPASKEINAKTVYEKIIMILSQNNAFENITQKKSLIKNVITLFVKTVKGDIKKNEYALSLERTFRQSGDYEEGPVWNIFFALLHKIIFSYYHGFPEKYMEIIDLIELSEIIISKLAHQLELNIRTKISGISGALQIFESRLLVSFDFDYILDTMSLELGSIGIRRCYLAFHTSNDKIFREARMIFAYEDKLRIDIDENKSVFPSDSLIPDSMIISNRRFDFIIESLLYKEEQLGFIIIESESLEGIPITPMTSHIASSIKASMLMNEAVQKGKNLESALNELKSNHEKLLIAEKMASLGRLTAGIAHEINSPLAAARSSLQELLTLINEYKSSIYSSDVTPENHEEISDDMLNSANLAEKALAQATGFIKGIKSQTREMNQHEGIIFNVIEVINESLLLLGFVLRKNSITVDFTYSKKQINLFGIPGKMANIITNLITNAIDAIGNKKNETIKINCYEDDNNIILCVEDKGSGIPESILTKIFDPLFTTKPFGQGTGLGLSIVHDIVYGELNGTIEVESKINEGTVFRIKFGKDQKRQIN